MTPTTSNCVYLTETVLSDMCFLVEALYWVAFQQLPEFWIDRDSFLSLGASDYEAEAALRRLAAEECERAGLPHDPRMSFEWAFDVASDDTLETIIEKAALVDPLTHTFDNPPAPREANGDPLPERSATPLREAHEEAVKLHNDLERWGPQYRTRLPMFARGFRNGRHDSF